MNKDVIYIEPEDDITDVITKIEKSKEKIVALVPPKKAGVFRSVVNIKLIHKAGKSAEKTVVLVTTDPSILKLAAASKLPVTSDLQTAPVIPKDDVEIDTTSKEELVEESDGTVETEEDVEELEKKDDDSKDDDDEEEDDEEDNDEDEKKDGKKAKAEKPKKAAKTKKVLTNNKFIDWFIEHKKLAIVTGVGILLLILILIWALVIAPSVTVNVEIRTTSNNFSEAVTFTTELDKEDALVGKFYLEEKKVETTEEVEFEATGKKNVGEKAKGTIVVYYDFPVAGEGGNVAINAGTAFINKNFSYTVDETAYIHWNGDVTTAKEDCENYGQPGWKQTGCRVSRKISVTAAESGSNYNTSSDSGWSTVADVKVGSASIDGGTDREITVVQQSDIDTAKSKLAGSSVEANKEKLLEKLGDDKMAIESSLKQEVTSLESTPKVGEEVKEDTKPTIKATTTTSIFVIDKTKVKEYIAEKANLKDDQEIYEMKDPFVESFILTDGGYNGKLKTSYLTGPKLSTSSVVELIKGRGLGDAQHLLKDINGVKDVKINPSFSWVTSIPNDSNRITVNLEIKDQSGNTVEQQGFNIPDEEKSEKNEKSADEAADESGENNE
ncbi:hypothetical protein IKF32_02790 [Candidatus Saccharibacteria bacterium]|nr:hypothetical protein [Candidatus Saccharibacteria bacterium]